VVGVIRNLQGSDFDILIAVVFDPAWQVQAAAKIPHDVISKVASFRNHVNGHVMHLRSSIFNHPTVEDIAALLV